MEPRRILAYILSITMGIIFAYGVIDAVDKAINHGTPETLYSMLLLVAISPMCLGTVQSMYYIISGRPIRRTN